MLPFALELGRPLVAAIVAALGASGLVALAGRPRARHAPRFLLVLAVALAAGDLRARDPEPPRLRIFVVDRSRSFEAAKAAIQATVGLGARDLDPVRDRVAVVAFGSAPLVVLEPSLPGEAREGARRALAATLDASATDLGAALDVALDVARSENAAAEVVAITDGRDTAGRARAAAARLAASGVPLHAVAPPAIGFANARVARVTAPTRVAVGEPAQVVVSVEATVPGRVTIDVRGDGFEVVGPGAISDQAAPDVPLRETFVVKPTRAGLISVKARVALEGDSDPEDDEQEAVLLAGDPSRALLVAESDAWRSVLEKARFAVERVAPEGLAKALATGPAPSLIVLDEIEERRIPFAVLDDFVKSGGGLVVAGDEHAFGPGGYGESPLEALLPVYSGPPDSRAKPLALELVIDASGSMDRARIGDGTRYTVAVRAVVPQAHELRKGDQVGVIVFDAQPHVRAAPPEKLLDDLLRDVKPGGETNIGLAVEKGLEELAARKGRRLLVVVTDGEDEREKIDRYLASIESRAESLGPDFEAALVALGGEGEKTLGLIERAIGKKAKVYSVAEAGPALARLVKGDLVSGRRGERREGEFVAQPDGFKVGSYAPVRPKELLSPEITLKDPERELPAALVVRSEHVLAVATDLEKGGAALAGAGLTRLLALVRSVARRDTDDLALECERESGWIRILARTSRPRLVAACGDERTPLRTVAPGELEARLRAPKDAVLVRILDGETALGGVSVPPESSLELAPPRRDLALLEELVRPSGGTVLPELGDLPRPRGKETQRALAGDLALAALAFLVLEGVVAVTLERLAARRAARRTFERA